VRSAAVILDFDGVIADSEVLSNRSLSDSLTEIGMAASYDDCLRDYYGHNWLETERRIVDRFGRPLPSDFRQRVSERTRALFAQELAPVRGIVEFLGRLGATPCAIASSSSRDYITWALALFGLADRFGAHIYSADGWLRGKPHPDIYIAAAGGLGVDPRLCLAIEDSPTGARAALAAGMHVVGFCGASHIVDPLVHRATLRDLGVHQLVGDFGELRLAVGVQPA
jgi:HAD superfamily hydrolase (TIGR01509 family)